MATKLTSLHHLYVFITCAMLLYPTTSTDDTAFDFNLDDVCLAEFHIEKYTMASSDSYRDNEMVLLIFPEAEPEYAPHFKQDYCARQSKCTLPFSCFKIHAPQTDQHSEGYLSVKALENEFSKKFYAVIHGYSNTDIKKNFDAFFDYNLGFWVESLHKYLTQINDNSEILTNYIGLKWHSPSPINKVFYSLIIHSPASQNVFELMSFNKPNLSLYPNLRSNFEFTEINEMRASFLPYLNQGRLPWNRDDGGDIVPIKISFGCSNIQTQIDFYTQVLEAKLNYFEQNTVSIIDGHLVSYAFLQPINDMIEIAYVQRPIDYTYGLFTTEVYKNLLLNTHNTVVVSPVCGLDRWFDNHYSFNTLKFANDQFDYNYMDRVLSRLIQRQMVWRLYHTPYEDESPEGKYWMAQFGFTDLYTLYVFDQNGQTIQMFGEFRDQNVLFNPPIYHKQWCYVPCPGNQMMGAFDERLVYKEDKSDVVYQIVSERNKAYNRLPIEEVAIYAHNGESVSMEGELEISDEDMDELEQEIIETTHGKERKLYIAAIVLIAIGMVSCLLIGFCVWRCLLSRNNMELSNGEMQHLLQAKMPMVCE